MFTYKQLKKFVKNAKKKDGLFEQNFLSFMECKLPSFMYRSSFLPNIFESIYYIKNNNVAINKVFRSSIFFPVKCMDIVTFRV
jgi:ribosomal protein S4